MVPFRSWRAFTTAKCATKWAVWGWMIAHRRHAISASGGLALMNGTIVFDEIGKGKELVEPHRLRKREPPNPWSVAGQRFCRHPSHV